MKRFWITVSLIVAVSAAPVSAATSSAPGGQPVPAHSAKKAEKPKIAPADEYFGKLKMSILGIANTIKDQGLRYERQPEQLSSELNAINFAIDALRDWEHKYPKDPWVAKSLFALERFYAKVNTDEGRAQAKATMLWLVRDFPNTWWGKTGKRELAEGKVGVPPPPTQATSAQAAPSTLDITKPVLGDSSPSPKPVK